MHKVASKRLRSCRGVTLIETLVTIMVLSIGLLGLAGMHMTGLKNNQSAYFRSQATILAYSILESMRANKASALNNEYDIELKEQPQNNDHVASQDLINWKNTLNAMLPVGDGQIDCTNDNPICTIIVQWDDSMGAGGEDSQQFSVVTQL